MAQAAHWDSMSVKWVDFYNRIVLNTQRDSTIRKPKRRFGAKVIK
jgi:hypothetical protein